ncbi:Glandicoline B O-methyltransferase roqN [Paramyrothecium foliicola]|nr:Glandicoline B O-methyltransferase roqN [Paramyrothecium foliicola]
MENREQHPQLPLPNYFSKFASVYATQTGYSTFNIVANVISENIQNSPYRIGPNSVVHDTAAGPAIGAAALVARLAKDDLPKEILISDNNAQMVQAARESLDSSPLSHGRCEELDSQNLASISDSYFTHSINNFSIFTFPRPADAVRETYRTLRPDGLALITCWRRFAPMYIVHAAQKSIRPDLPLLPTPSPEFCEEGVLQKTVESAGFDHAKIKVTHSTLVVSDADNKARLTALMCGPMMARARAGYTPEEESRWPAAVQQAVEAEVEQFGGIRFEAYILLANK